MSPLHCAVWVRNIFGIGRLSPAEPKEEGILLSLAFIADAVGFHRNRSARAVHLTV